ncbi:MAG: glycosyltransferase family 4 protein [Phycisphaerae bacterium]
MHVCHIITRLIVGGAQENTILSCEGLHQRGYEVTLMTGPTTGPEGSLVERARAGGYRYVEIPELRRAINPWFDARAQRVMRAELGDLAPDLVHTHSSKAGILGRNAAFEARVPRIVHTIHGMSFNRTQPWWLQRLYQTLERRAARRTHAIATVADAMIEQTVAARICPRNKLQTIYSGMEIERFTPNPATRAATRAAWGISEDAVVVATVARLFRKKGYEQLIPIMRTIANQNENVRFVWVGDGAQRAEYEAELRRSGLRDRTVLAGLVPPNVVATLLAGADILAHTSQWEGLPRVVVQALLMQVPVVAFDVDGTREVVIEHETGRLISLNDEAAFAAALLEMARDAAQRVRFGRAGRDLCRERFDARLMIDQLEKLYRRL